MGDKYDTLALYWGNQYANKPFHESWEDKCKDRTGYDRKAMVGQAIDSFFIGKEPADMPWMVWVAGQDDIPKQAPLQMMEKVKLPDSKHRIGVDVNRIWEFLPEFTLADTKEKKGKLVREGRCIKAAIEARAQADKFTLAKAENVDDFNRVQQQMQGYKDLGYKVVLISFQRSFRESDTEVEGTLTLYQKGSYATHFNAVHGYAELLKADPNAENFLLDKDFLGAQAQAAAGPAFHSGKQGTRLKNDNPIGVLSKNGPDLFVQVNVDDEGNIQSLEKQVLSDGPEVIHAEEQVQIVDGTVDLQHLK